MAQAPPCLRPCSLILHSANEHVHMAETPPSCDESLTAFHGILEDVFSPFAIFSLASHFFLLSSEIKANFLGVENHLASETRSFCTASRARFRRLIPLSEQIPKLNYHGNSLFIVIVELLLTDTLNSGHLHITAIHRYTDCYCQRNTY